jgi:hypothetical protein
VDAGGGDELVGERGGGMEGEASAHAVADADLRPREAHSLDPWVGFGVFCAYAAAALLAAGVLLTRRDA